MFRHILKTVGFDVALLLFPIAVMAYSTGPLDGYSNNPPARQNCTACHTSFGFNSGNGRLELLGLPDSGYHPGSTYRLTVQLSDPNARRWGFEITAIGADHSRLGNLAVVNSALTQISNPAGHSPQYIKHKSAGTFPDRLKATVGRWTGRLRLRTLERPPSTSAETPPTITEPTPAIASTASRFL